MKKPMQNRPAVAEQLPSLLLTPHQEGNIQYINLDNTAVSPRPLKDYPAMLYCLFIDEGEHSNVH